MSEPQRKPEELIAQMVEELAQLPPIPMRLLLAPRLFERLRNEVRPGFAAEGRFPIGALEVRESDAVRTWAIEMTNGTFQLPEEELEGDG